MERKTSYFVSRKNVLTWLMALCMVCSAVARIFFGVKGTDTWSQIVLPIAAALLYAAINTEDPEDAIRTLGKRITAVHIHDNNFVNDRHTIPYLGKANWDAICQAFADIGYEGEFTLETVLYENSFPAELLPAALKFEAEIAKHLIAKIEKG